MEPLLVDPDHAMKKQIWEVVLFLERMKTAFREFPPALQKQLDMNRVGAAANELKTVVAHVMETGDALVPRKPERYA